MTTTQAKRRFVSTSSEETKRLQHDIEPITNEEENSTSSHSITLPSAATCVDNEPSSESTDALKSSLSIDQLYEAERETNKVNHWRENYYAAGLVEPTWNDEIRRMVGTPENDEKDCNGPNRTCCEDSTSDQIDPTCGCLICSAFIFSRIGAGRIGNMAVLKESNILIKVEKDEEDDDENANSVDRIERHRKIDIIVGPYWPCLVFVTYPLIIIVSLITAFKAVFVHGQNLIIQIVWSFLSGFLLYALFEVGCRDPGIVRKYREYPTSMGHPQPGWKWNDQSQSFKPRNSFYDSDCAVVVEEFDHTCPWTGTAIGKKNMVAFKAFVGLVFICLPMDILLLAYMAT